MKKRNIETNDTVPVKMPPKAQKEIRAMMKELGVSEPCAANCMIVAALMKLGDYKTKAEYTRAIRWIEHKFDYRIADRMPPYMKGGDPTAIAQFEKCAEKARKAKAAKKLTATKAKKGKRK